jgi:hypothetical protein
MKFALVQGQRQEAQPGLAGNCPACGHPLVAKCGEVKFWHWAHKSGRLCDPWWENETEWHRAWKDQFPLDWQEVVHHAEDGEKHIADIKTDRDWFIEIQHSYIEPEERRSRDAFYKKLVWVVDATRRKTDVAQFRKALEASTSVGNSPHLRRVHSEDCALLREWASSSVPIFFDFGPGPSIWWHLSARTDGSAYVMPFSRSEFIHIHRGGATQLAQDFDGFVKDLGKLLTDYEAARRAQAQPQPFRLIRRGRSRRL